MAKPHLDVQKVASMNNLQDRYIHNLRLNKDEDLNHIDPTKTYLNHDLINFSNVFYRELVENRLNEVSLEVGNDVKKRKDAVIALSVYLAYTHGAEETNHFSVDEWEQASLKWLQDYFGVENVVAATVHLDESSPHIHAIVVPITKDLRLCAKEYMEKPKLSAMHQSYGRAMSVEPFCMEMPKQYVKKAKHHSIREFYEQINAIDDLQLPQKEPQESAEKYFERVLEFGRNIKRRSLADKNLLETKVEHLYADVRKLFADYREAINLYQYLCRIFGNRELANQELQRLYQMEHCPRADIDRMVEQLTQEHKEEIEKQVGIFLAVSKTRK